MKKLDTRTLRRIHMGTDVILVSLAWVGAYWLRYALSDVLDTPLNSFDTYRIALPAIVVPWIASCWIFDIYRSARMSTLIEHIQDLFKGVFLGLLVISAMSFFVREAQFGRLVVLFTAGLCLLFQGCSRIFFYRINRRLQHSGRTDVPALILGTGTAAIRLLQKLQDHPETGYRVAGFLSEADPIEEKDVAGRPVLGHIDDLRAVAVEHHIEEVFIALPGLGHTRMLAMVLDLEDLHLTFRVVTNLFEVLTAGTPVDLVDDLPLVRLGRPETSFLYRPCKRAIDLTIGGLAFLLSLPVLALCAIRIRLDSPGPVVFSQQRVGLNGRTFTMHKLRTMRADVDPYEESPSAAADPRLSSFGRFLRQTSLDELPQLINVLRGDMSLVGPRPEMPFMVEQYDEWQRRRLSVKPGMTGLWQILGRKDLPMQENLQYDFYYIRNRSLLFDLSIMIRTIGAVVSRKGAF